MYSENLINIFPETYEAYKRNKNVFNEALIYLNFSLNRIDFPYCISDLNRYSLIKMGITLGDLQDRFDELGDIDKDLEFSNIEDNIEKEYNKELYLFSNCIDGIIDRLYHFTLDSSELFQVITSKGKANKINIRFVTQDYNTFDISLSKSNFDFLMEALSKVKFDEDNNNGQV